MPLPLDEILSIKGNKYEATVAAIKYAKALSREYNDVTDIPVGKNRTEKVALLALREVLSGNIEYVLEDLPKPKK
ncbi:MAG: DNA-directed RNA polymerase subunit omega [Brevinema sp.]